MTTASPMSVATNVDVEFAYGAGQINPVKAVSPGLVYDLGEADYASFLCGQGYAAKSLQLVTGDNSTCSAENNGTVWDLNYPSFAVSVESKAVTRVFRRTVTNVGSPVSTYKAIVVAPTGLQVQVQPSILSFKATGQKQSFTVTVGATVATKILSASLLWDDGVSSQVRSPIVAFASRASESLLRSYTRSFNGFAAKLTEEESKSLARMEGVVSVFPSAKKQLLTTRSWDFVGFPQEVKRTKLERDVIVAMFDTGIWPESDSFSDEGFGPPPSKWKGTCQSSSNFTCNNKIIGAKFYHGEGTPPEEDFESPRDSEGHGTHTASTAAGALVSNASLLGLGSGTARGGVPSARIAVYKICWSNGCSESDILAAFDDAIADGVDIISLSVGGNFPFDYFEDSIAIGAFHSMKNGILTSNSAGNSGPGPGSVANFSPWSLTVAASTIDRKFVAKVQLGNKKVYDGAAVNTFVLKNGMYGLVYGGDVPNTAAGFDGSESRYCIADSLDKALVKDKIVLCDQLSSGEDTLDSGAIGTIMQDDGFKDFAFAFPLAASYLSSLNGSEISHYINVTSKATATILKSIEAKDALAPYVVSFSSRGPNPITRDILKSVCLYNGSSIFIFVASVLSATTNTDMEFAYGAGQIDPAKAANPGLVYDSEEIDYVKFLCGQGYSTKSLQLVTGDNTTCSAANNGTVWDLNYPSFALSALSSNVTRVFHRTVTNVGSPVSTYKAIVAAPKGLEVQVKPSVLSFKSLGQKQSFVVTVAATVPTKVISGSLVWDDGVFRVRSPIVAFSSS
ncbi:hypothetical protein RJ639_039949 [Escallonia herrerae]|uniref:Cucumisin n=1 Tax=Escallonia herrerae TaxID=1293975 RepID=A0AA89BDG2_9ASTE|nr:hypothetical protein RJ639_039949 [Escallonia herrerae]